MFTTNVGNTDRAIRVILGIVLLVVWFLAPGHGLRWVPLVLGIAALATGLLSTCPLYSLLGINTCSSKKA